MIEKKLKVSQSEIDEVRDKLIGAKIENDMTENEKKEIMNEIDVKIQRAIDGWNTAPKEFKMRCMILFGVDESWLPRNRRTHDQTEVDDIDTSYDREMLSGLTNREKRIFKQRVESYKKEFDLNDSSDYAMILQIVADEVLQRRYIRDILLEKKNDVSKLIDLLNKRLSSNLETLGITRSKRKELQEEQEGHVAQISDSLDEKLRSIAKIHKEHMEEEDMYMKMKNSRSGPVNVIPSMQELQETAEEFGYEAKS
jgi:hypothetical protein